MLPVDSSASFYLFRVRYAIFSGNTASSLIHHLCIVYCLFGCSVLWGKISPQRSSLSLVFFYFHVLVFWILREWNSTIDFLQTLLKKYVIIRLLDYFKVLQSVPLGCVPIFRAESCCFDYYNIAVHFKVGHYQEFFASFLQWQKTALDKQSSCGFGESLTVIVHSVKDAGDIFTSSILYFLILLSSTEIVIINY